MGAGHGRVRSDRRKGGGVERGRRDADSRHGGGGMRSCWRSREID